MVLTTEFQKVLEASTKITSNTTGYLRLYLKYGGRDLVNNKDIIYYEIRQYAYNPYGNYLAWEWTGDLSWNIKLGTTTKESGKYKQTPAIYTDGNEVVRASGSWEQPHNADGSWSSDISFDGYVYQTKVSNSGSITLPTIPRASSVSGGNGNIGEKTTINISRASSSFTHKLYFSFGNLAWQFIATGVGTSYSWTIPTSLYAQIPNANSGTGTIHCETYSGSTYIGTISCSFTAKVVNSNPVIGSFTYKDSNSTTTAITGNNQRIIRNNSNLLFTIGSATAKNSATISKYEITFNNVTKSRTSAGDLDFGKINLSTYSNATLKVTDSRGNSSSVNLAVIIDDWVLPTALITLNRKNNFYSETYLEVDGSYSYLNGKNSITIQYQYKKVVDSSYSELQTLLENEEEILDLDNQYQWNVRVLIKDRIGETVYNLFLDRGMPIIYYDRFNSSVGINCFPTGANDLYVNGCPIVESGENSNGKWIKYADGTMICRCSRSFANLDCTIAWGTVYETESFDLGYFPQSFIEVPDIYLTSQNIAGNTSKACFIEWISNTSTDRIGGTIVARPVKGSIVNLHLSILAIGRWR